MQKQMTLLLLLLTAALTACSYFESDPPTDTAVASAPTAPIVPTATLRPFSTPTALPVPTATATPLPTPTPTATPCDINILRNASAAVYRLASFESAYRTTLSETDNILSDSITNFAVEMTEGAVSVLASESNVGEQSRLIANENALYKQDSAESEWQIVPGEAGSATIDRFNSSIFVDPALFDRLEGVPCVRTDGTQARSQWTLENIDTSGLTNINTTYFDERELMLGLATVSLSFIQQDTETVLESVVYSIPVAGDESFVFETSLALVLSDTPFSIELPNVVTITSFALDVPLPLETIVSITEDTASALTFTTSLSEAEVFEFFESELTEVGWTSENATVADEAGTEIDVLLYNRDGERFAIGVLDYLELTVVGLVLESEQAESP